MEKAFIIYGERLKKPVIKNNALVIPLGAGKSSALQITTPDKVRKIKKAIDEYLTSSAGAAACPGVLLFVCVETCGDLTYCENDIHIPVRDGAQVRICTPKGSGVVSRAEKLFNSLTLS